MSSTIPAIRKLLGLLYQRESKWDFLNRQIEGIRKKLDALAAVRKPTL